MTIGDIDRTPIYPTTEFNLEKLTRISSLDLENDIELPKLPNGVGDRWLSDGSIERNVSKKIVFDGSENWRYEGEGTDLVLFGIDYPFNYAFESYTDVNKAISNRIFEQGYNDTTTGAYKMMFININYLRFAILKADLTDWDDSLTNNQKINLFKEWVSNNNIELYYQLADSIIETAPIFPEFIDYYDGGSVIVDDGIIDYTVVGNQTRINYIEGNITTVVDGQFIISKPTKIISKSNDLYEYDLSNLPSYLEYGSLSQDTYNNTLELINNNQNKQIKIFFDDNIQESRYNIYLENDVIIINNDREVMRIYNDNTYTSTRNLDTDITYKLEGYHIIDYIDGKFDNTVLAFFWIIPVLLAGGLIYLALKRKE